MENKDNISAVEQKNNKEAEKMNDMDSNQKLVNFSNLFVLLGFFIFSIVLILSLNLRKPSMQSISGFKNPLSGETYDLTVEEMANWSKDISDSCSGKNENSDDWVDIAVVCSNETLLTLVSQIASSLPNLSENDFIDYVDDLFYDLSENVKIWNDIFFNSGHNNTFYTYKGADFFTWEKINSYVISFSIMTGLYSVAVLQSVLFRKKDPRSGQYNLNYSDVYSGLLGGVLPGIKIFKIVKNSSK